MANPNQKKPRFNLFNLAKDGRGVKKQDVIRSYTLLNFFKLYGRRFGTIVSTNLLYVFCNFPIWFALFGLSGISGTESRVHLSVLYPILRAVTVGEANPVTAALHGVIGLRQINYILSPLSYVLLGLSLLALFTFGPVNTGCAYILRNVVKCEPIFLFSDFWYAIKRNWKQSLLFGVLDALLCALLTYDIIFFYANADSFLKRVMFFLAIALAVIYFVMRFYFYVMMVTFDLSIPKLIKNGFIFSVVGLKRNTLAFLGILASVALWYFIFNVYLPIGAVLPLVLLFGSCSFMGIYAAYPQIKKIMIDPYYTEEESEAREEPIFHDRG